MRILVIHDDAAIPGGANAYRRSLSDLLRKEGDEIFLFSFKLGPGEDPRYALEYRHADVKWVRHLSRNYFNPSLYRALRRWIREIRPDLIHIHHNYLFTSTVLLACRGGIPVIQTIHDYRIICPAGRGVLNNGTLCKKGYGFDCRRDGCLSFKEYLFHRIPNRLGRNLLRMTADAVVAPSRFMQDSLRGIGVNAEWIPQFIDPSGYGAGPFPAPGNRVLFVGILYPCKGVSDLLAAFSIVSKAIPDARLDVIGDGSEKPVLEEMAGLYGLKDRVHFHGLLPPEKVSAFYQQASVLVLPSIHIENSPLVVLEAMASGRPVIGSRIGGIPELIGEGSTGLLFSPGNREELAEKVIEILKDRKKAETMGRQGREKVLKEFSRERCLEAYQDLFARLTANHY
jgi:glycosyltransferase involved in cell wall biosynthesis